MRYWLVMPAAGVGRRFGQQRPKQYAPLRGRSVIEWALTPFLTDSRCAGVVVALAAGDPYWPEVATRLARGRDQGLVGPAAEIIIAPGGAERSGSVRNALAALSTLARPDDWVLVHDAARPCLSSKDLDQLLTRLESHRAGGLLATPAADTLKRATLQPPEAAGRTAVAENEVRDVELTSRQANAQPVGPQVQETVDRAGLWRALTPQMFRYARLCEALDRAAAVGRYPTDEAQAVEWLGDRPVLVEGSAANIKITSADDLVLAEALLGARA
jgi:2-C-methyl-D-erythritol 4-phosphate cytidylyltransferase